MTLKGLCDLSMLRSYVMESYSLEGLNRIFHKLFSRSGRGRKRFFPFHSVRSCCQLVFFLCNAGIHFQLNKNIMF